MSRRIIIIGNGIAGITCARTLRKRDPEVEIIVISGESKYFYSRTALMYVFMGHLKMEHTEPYEPWFWEKNRIELLQDWVTGIDPDARSIKLQENGRLRYDELILATGSKPNKFGWPGENLEGVRGLYSRQDLAYLENYSPKIETAVIVGGGLIGIELAEMLKSKGKKVHFLIREKSFWNKVLPDPESELITQHIEKHGVELHLETELQEIIGASNGQVEAVRTKAGQLIPCQYVGLTAGVSPNIKVALSAGISCNKGILVNEYLQTETPHIHAIGDCAELKHPTHGRKAIEAVWYTGKMMGQTLASTLTGNPVTYDPGHSFNSAKFFDIEYQTYGTVHSRLQENESDFYWQHPTEELAIHFVFEKDTGKFLGVNSFGIRLRHEAFDHWLKKGAHIEKVLSQMRNANFDPEFYRTHEGAIIEKFNRSFGTQIKAQRKNWAEILKFSKS